MGAPSPAERTAYYRAALRCLQYVEGRKPTGRRFGPDADARWSQFKGELTTADRIDLMIRDADAEWPGAVGARTVFGLKAVAEDETFGADWEPLDPVDAEELWRGLPPPPTTVGDALTACAEAWGLDLSPVEVGAVGPADKLVVSGPRAVASLIAAFAGGRDLDWTDQVVCVATPPAHRQLAAMAGVLLNATKTVTVLSSDSREPIGLGRRLIYSNDAAEEDQIKAGVPQKEA
jgi:hypothetical protein